MISKGEEVRINAKCFIAQKQSNGVLGLKIVEGLTVDVCGDDWDVVFVHFREEIWAVLKGEDGQAKDGAHGGADNFGIEEFDRTAGEEEAFAVSGFGSAHDHAEIARISDAIEYEDWTL